MPATTIAKTIAEIAEQERVRAVRAGDYVWALFCAMVEEKALMHKSRNQ